MQPSQRSGPIRSISPAGRALAVLMTIEDSLPVHESVLFVRDGVVVVLVDGFTAFAEWVVALQERHEERVSAQADVHLSTVETRVCGCPVCVLRGEFFPESLLAEAVAA